MYSLALSFTTPPCITTIGIDLQMESDGGNERTFSPNKLQRFFLFISYINLDMPKAFPKIQRMGKRGAGEEEACLNSFTRAFYSVKRA